MRKVNVKSRTTLTTETLLAGKSVRIHDSSGYTLDCITRAIAPYGIVVDTPNGARSFIPMHTIAEVEVLA